MNELVKKYLMIIKACWQARKKLDSPGYSQKEAEFLPAALSLQTTPLHPLPRYFARAIIAFLIIIILWSILGKVDIVATATGKLIVSDKVKTIQPLEKSVVRRILVKDGDSVVEGQTLIELDPTIQGANRVHIDQQIVDNQSELIRAQYLLEAVDNRANIKTIEQKISNEDIFSHFLIELAEYNAKLANIEAEMQRKKMETLTVKENIKKNEFVLAVLEKRETDFNNLAQLGAVPMHSMQDSAKEKMQQLSDLNILKARLAENASSIQESEQHKTSYIAEYKKNLMTRKIQALAKKIELKQESIKINNNENLNIIRSPVSGIVQQLSVNTVGGVVTEAQNLMLIVPSHQKVTAEIVIENKDIGFVNVGDNAEVKVDTFSYTKYGLVNGKIKTISADAVIDEKRGPIFTAMIELQDDSLLVENKTIKLSPGMTVVADIKTGDRRLIEYFLNPIKKTTMESLKER